MVKWTPEDMEAAVNAVIDGEMTMRKAAFTFGIPKSTLATHHVKNVKIGVVTCVLTLIFSVKPLL